MTYLRSVPADPPPEGGGSVGAQLAELLRRASRGDESAFAEWYDATSARAFGLAVRVLRDRAQAEEVTQEAYLECWRHAARFDPAKGSAISWLLTIVHRKAVDRVRSAEASGRRDEAYSHKAADRRPRLHRRGGRGVTGGQAGPCRPGGPDPQAAPGRGARVPRRLHPYRGGQDARSPDRHRQDPDQGRLDPAERRAGRRRGSAGMNHLTPFCGSPAPLLHHITQEGPR